MLLQNLVDNRPWSTISDLDHLQQRLARLLSSDMSGSEFPPLNVWGSEDEIVVTSDLPGLTPEDLDISVVNETLVLKMRRQPAELAEGERWLRRERVTGEFSRTLQLPFVVDVDRVQASVSDGLLKITLPRAEADRPRRIAIASV
jgi:HSP20 family protein